MGGRGVKSTVIAPQLAFRDFCVGKTIALYAGVGMCII